LSSPGQSAGDTSFQTLDSESPVRQKPGLSQPPVSQKINKLATLGLDWVLPKKRDVVVIDHGIEKLNLKESLVSTAAPTPANSGGFLGATANTNGISPTTPSTGGFPPTVVNSGFPPTDVVNGAFRPTVRQTEAFAPPPPQLGAFIPLTAQSKESPPKTDQLGGFENSDTPIPSQFSFGEAQWGDTLPEQIPERREKKKKKHRKDVINEEKDWPDRESRVTFGEAEEFYDGESRPHTPDSITTDIVLAEVTEVSLVFMPGQLGIDADWSTGKVGRVHPESQAAVAGVKPGWRMIKVNDQAYIESLLDACIAGAQEFSVTFSTKDSATNSPTPTDASSSPPQSRPPGQNAVPNKQNHRTKGFKFPFCCGSTKKPSRLGQFTDDEDD